MAADKKGILSEEETQQLVDAIKIAEQSTSGEIRVHIEQTKKHDSMNRAFDVFHALRMTETSNRNGVLLYVCMNDHSFVIIGDEGIDSKVGETYWNDIKDHVIKFLSEGRIKDGLVEGIRLVGTKLSELFPKNDLYNNELPNEITSDEDIN